MVVDFVMDRGLALSDTEIASMLSSIQSGTLNTTYAAEQLHWMGFTTMPTADLAKLMGTMSKSQIMSVFETIVGSPNAKPNLGESILRTIWTLLAISTLVLAARLYVKWRVMRRIYYDDACMLAALVFGYLNTIFITIAVHNGLGQHLVFLSSEKRQRCVHIGYIAVGWGMIAPMFGRISFLISLLFVAGIDPKIRKWTIYAFIVLQLIFNIGACIVLYAQCGNHLNVIWSPTIWSDYPKYCWDPSVQSDYGHISGTFNSITDLFLTALPAIMIFHTKLPGREKLGLVFLLCLGILAFIASIVKTYESKALAEIADYTYDLVPYAIWIAIEFNIVMIISSIPFLRPLFNAILRQVRGKHGKVQEKFENISLTSMLSKKGRTSVLPTSSSQEHIAPQQDPFTITQTVEVSVTTSPHTDVTMVHAALVGLVEDDTKIKAVIWH